MQYFSQLIYCIVSINIAFFILCISGLADFSFNQHRLFELEIIGFNLLLVILNTSYRQALIKQFYCFSPLTRKALYAILLLALASTYLAPLSGYAALELSSYIGLFLLSLSVANLAFQAPFFFEQACTSIFIAGSFVYQIIFFTGYSASVIEHIPLEWPEPFIGFANIRFFNQYQLWIYFFISLPLLKPIQLNPLLRSSLFLIAIGWATLLFVSGSRGAIIALFLSLGISALVLKKTAFSFIKLHLVLLFTGFLGAMLLFKFLPALSHANTASLGWRTVEQITDNSPRFYLWHQALDYIIAHPFLGIGPMHYAYYPNNVALHPHNSFLQWACELGLPSVFIVTGLVMRGIWQWIKSFDNSLEKNKVVENGFQLEVVLFCTLLANLIYSQADGVIVMPVSQVLMATITGWIFGVYFYKTYRQASQPVTTLLQSVTMLLLAGIVLISLFYLTLPQIIEQARSFTENNYIIETEIVAPRFWLNGVIS